MSRLTHLLRAIYENKKKAKCLKIISTAAVYTVAAFFLLELLILLFAGALVDLLIVALSAAVGYVSVSVARRIVNAKRPYEVYDFYEVKPKEKKGCSFPSRHTYSAFVISVLLWVVSPVYSVATFILATLIGVTRVLLGIHFVRDVVAGAVCGAVFGVAGVLLAHFF